jgi:hypothetical protein
MCRGWFAVFSMGKKTKSQTLKTVTMMKTTKPAKTTNTSKTVKMSKQQKPSKH